MNHNEKQVMIQGRLSGPELRVLEHAQKLSGNRSIASMVVEGTMDLARAIIREKDPEFLEETKALAFP